MADIKSAAGEGPEPRVPGRDQSAQELANLIAQSEAGAKGKGFWRRRRRKTTTPEPATPEPTAPAPTAPGPSAAEPTGPESTAAKPTAPESTVAEPTAAEPTGAEPSAAEPTGAEGTVPESTAPESTATEPSAAEPDAPADGAAKPVEPTTEAGASGTPGEPTKVAEAVEGEGAAKVGEPPADEARAEGAADEAASTGDVSGAAEEGDGDKAAEEVAESAVAESEAGDAAEDVERPRPTVGVVYEPDESPDGFPLEYGNIIVGLPKQADGSTVEDDEATVYAAELAAVESAARESAQSESEVDPGNAVAESEGAKSSGKAVVADQETTESSDGESGDEVEKTAEDAAADADVTPAAKSADEASPEAAKASDGQSESAGEAEDSVAEGADGAAGESADGGVVDGAGGAADAAVEQTTADGGSKSAAESKAEVVESPSEQADGEAAAEESAAAAKTAEVAGSDGEQSSAGDESDLDAESDGVVAESAGEQLEGPVVDGAVADEPAGEAAVAAGKSADAAVSVGEQSSGDAGPESGAESASEQSDGVAVADEPADEAAVAAGKSAEDGGAESGGVGQGAGEQADGGVVAGQAAGGESTDVVTDGAADGVASEVDDAAGGAGAGQATGDGGAELAAGSEGADGDGAGESAGERVDEAVTQPADDASAVVGQASGDEVGAAVGQASGDGSAAGSEGVEGAGEAAGDGVGEVAGESADDVTAAAEQADDESAAAGESEGVAADGSGEAAGDGDGEAEGVAELTAEELAERLAAEQAAMALITALMKLRGALAGSRLPLDVVGADEARQQQKAMLDQLDDYILPRLVQLEAPILAVVGGSTGAGKSTLVNSVIGKVVSEPGVLRPTTRSPVLIHHPADADWFIGDRVLPGMARTTAESPGGMEDPGQLRLVASDTVPRGLAVLDAPDIDSVVEANRDLATQLLAAADLWLFVTTAARYSDAVPWEFLQSASDRSTAVAVVLDRAPAETIDDITGHLAQMLLERGLGDSPLFSIKETVVDGNGMLPVETVASIKEWLVDLAADAEARAAVVRRTLQGAVTSMVKTTPPFAAAVRAQGDTAIELRSSAEAAYDQAVKDIGTATQDASLLRGEVLARWQEFVGTGELLKGLQGNSGKKAKKPAPSVAQTRSLNDAIESGLSSLLIEQAEAAAERAEKSWQASPAGRQLLAAAKAVPGTDDATDAQSATEIVLGAMSPEFAAKAERAVREWQAGVLELVREVGTEKRLAARILDAGVNGLSLSVMVVLFAENAGIPTGAEASIGVGSAVVGQKLLTAVFGDAAVQTLMSRSRADLDGKVHALMDAEFARYLAVLDQHPVDPEAARQLTEAARAVEDCT
ncbi:AAA family ATPase [Kribbella sp. NPDC020789]